MLCALALGLTLLNPKPFDFYTNGPYDPAVPKPETILGYGPGERQTTYHLQEEVVRTISEHARSRVRYISYGKTAEGRGLRVLAISSPDNMAHLDAIRQANLDLANGKGVPASGLHRQPTIVWINECIHGDEPASFESSMFLLYNLAASRAPSIEKLLDQAVVILNPSYNPDGHERFAVWYDSVASGNPNPGSFEHQEPGIVSGRLNHYRFDMNRDRVAFSQAETRQEVAEFLRWCPQVYVDQHGQVPTYFFPPTSMSVNANVDRARYNKWTEVFGRATGQAFDREGFPYYIRDVFDLYYPGYLDSWSTLSGAIGMTHETDGSYTINSLRADGSLATLRGSMAKHFTSALAVLGAAANHREELLSSFAAFKAAAASGKLAGKLQCAVAVSYDPEEIVDLQDQLARMGIRSMRWAKPAPAQDSVGFWGGKPEPAGGMGLVVPMAQPQGALAKALFDPSSDFEPEFVKEQIRRRQSSRGEERYPERESAEFYDVTAWNPIFARNLMGWWQSSVPPGTHLEEAAHSRAAGAAPVALSTVGYIAQPSLLASEIVFDLLQKGVSVEVATKPIKLANSTTYLPGSFIVYQGRNGADLPSLIQQAEVARTANEFGSVFQALTSSYPEGTRYGAGSEAVNPVRKPNVGIVFGDESAPTNFGAMWFLMEREFKLPFTPLTKDALSGDLSRYSCIVFPRGQYDEPSDKLKDWINHGGCAVVLGAQGWVMGDKGLVKLEQMKGEKGKAPEELPGAFFRADLDPRSFLSYGYGDVREDKRITIAVPVQGSRFYKAKPEGGGAVVFSSDASVKKLLSGWEWPDDTEKNLAGAVWLHDQPMGSGHVILFTEDPTTRAMWPGLYKLVLNAMLLGPAARAE
jgi:hypothetical protein